VAQLGIEPGVGYPLSYRLTALRSPLSGY